MIDIQEKYLGNVNAEVEDWWVMGYFESAFLFLARKSLKDSSIELENP